MDTMRLAKYLDYFKIKLQQYFHSQNTTLPVNEKCISLLLLPSGTWHKRWRSRSCVEQEATSRALLYKVTSTRIWLHVEEGEASSPVVESGRKKVCLSTVQSLSVSSSHLDFLCVVHSVSCVLKCTYSSENEGLSNTGVSPPECCSSPDQNLKSWWRTCDLFIFKYNINQKRLEHYCTVGFSCHRMCWV